MVFFEEIKLFYALLWDWGIFSRNWEKKWVPMYTAVVAYFTTTAQPFPIFRKLLAIAPSIKNPPQLIILNQKLNSNFKSPMLQTQLVVWYQINTNTDASNPEPQKILKTHMELWLITMRESLLY